MYRITSSLYLCIFLSSSLKVCEKLRETLVAISKKISTVHYGRTYWTDLLFVRVHPNFHKLIEYFVNGGERWPCRPLLLAIARNSLLLFFLCDLQKIPQTQELFANEIVWIVQQLSSEWFLVSLICVLKIFVFILLEEMMWTERKMWLLTVLIKEE